MSELVDYLTFCSYRHNRQISPQVTLEQWEKVYGAATRQMEQKYQEEKRFASPELAYRAACNHWNECSRCRKAGGEWADLEALCAIGRQLTKLWAEAEKRFARIEEDFWDSRSGA